MARARVGRDRRAGCRLGRPEGQRHGGQNIAHNPCTHRWARDMPDTLIPPSTPWRCVMRGRPDPPPGHRAVPIHLTTSFVFDSSEHAASLFNAERSGHVYSRISNPTNAVLEERVAALEGGSGAIAVPADRRPCTWPWPLLAGAGHHVVASSALVWRLAQPAAIHAQALRHRDHLRAAQ